MAAIARLSPNYFAWQFKRATGLPPHQYVLTRRVERAKQLLQTGSDISLAEVAAHAGFSDQSQFSHHFKRLVDVTAISKAVLAAGAAAEPAQIAKLSGTPRTGVTESSSRGTFTFPSKSTDYEVGTKASSASSRAAQPRHPCHTPGRCTASRHARCWHAPFP
jgi:Helix-turn-helix domain